MRPTQSKMFFYESFANEFDAHMNMYDVHKRLSVVFDELLTEDITGKLLLDAGCGTGWFSRRAVERGARVVSMDLGLQLLHQTAKKCASHRTVGSLLALPYNDQSFDYVICSEVIEHTPDPNMAIEELCRVLKVNGVLILTTPNRFWYFALWIATVFNLRPYQGLENWSSWTGLRRQLESRRMSIESMVGVHAFPFVWSKTYPLLDWLHRLRRPFGPFMLNIAVKCRRIIPLS